MTESNVKVCEQVSIEEFARELNLEVLHTGSDRFITFTTFNINRPGLFLSGYRKHFPSSRAQVIGETETSYLKSLTRSKRAEMLSELFAQPVPCCIISTGLTPPKEFFEAAQGSNVPVFRSPKRSSLLSNDLVLYLNGLLAPTESRHGVLVDIYGIGVMLTGNSGIGKSETALELVQRGHRLVADDAVLIKYVNDRLIGSSPPIIRYFMEVRGIGIIDVRSMYGVGAVMESCRIDMIVEMELWNQAKSYDRLGLTTETREILGVSLPCITMPVKPGRNLAALLEVAARNHRLKSLGYNSAEELDKRISPK